MQFSRILAGVVLSPFALSATGCLVIRVAGKTATTAIGAATEVTAATIRGTGRIAAAAVGASGEVADEGVAVAGRLSKSGMVVFFDPQSGLTWEVPWRDGLKLASAAELARIDAGLTAARVIRGGKVVDANQRASFLVRAGDVVELARRR